MRHGTLDALIERCADSDRTTRKFACFAIGNAGFHSDALYPPLRAAIPPLVALLADEEDKTRANAAAALGNLVRNSAVLCGELVNARALEVGVTGGCTRAFNPVTRLEFDPTRAAVSKATDAWFSMNPMESLNP